MAGKKTRMLVLGGYLGAGKTTLAVNLGRILSDVHGKGVAIITNDQGDVLVDTEYSKDCGFETTEITGGCFCTNFDGFVHKARDLVGSGRPDIIIAEPIGTSTNIMGSVVSPLRSLYPDEFSVAPFCVAVDCVRALDIIEKGKERREDSVDLIPEHQIRDAETVVLTKTDLVSWDTVSEIKKQILGLIPGAEIYETTSTDLDSLGPLCEMLLSDKVSEKAPVGDDNRMFAFEKAKLGWYSGTYSIDPEDDVDMYGLCTDLLRGVAKNYDSRSIVHVKVIVESPDAAAKMSLVEETMQVDDIHGSRYVKSPGRLVLNARVISPPKRLEEVMRGLVEEASGGHPFTYERVSEKCFMPKPESPSHFFFE